MTGESALPVVRYDRGVQVAGSPLWLDASTARELCMLTTLENKLPPLHKRVLASAPMADALSRAGYRTHVLPVPWRRSIGVGGFQVELIDLGHELGFAHALLESSLHRILYLGKTHHSNALLPKAEHVVMSMPVPNPVLPGVDVDCAVRELEILMASQVRLLIEVDNIGLAAILYRRLAERGFFLNASGMLGKLLLPPQVSDKVLAQLPMMRLQGRPMLRGRRLCMVETGQGTANSTTAEHVIHVMWNLDLHAVSRILRAVSASCVWISDVPELHQEHIAHALAPVAETRFLETRAQLSIF